MPKTNLATVVIAAVVHLAAVGVVAALWAIGAMSPEVGAGFLGALLGLGGGAGVTALANTNSTTSSDPTSAGGTAGAAAPQVNQALGQALIAAGHSITGTTTAATATAPPVGG